jgi:hypothetical protein
MRNAARSRVRVADDRAQPRLRDPLAAAPYCVDLPDVLHHRFFIEDRSLHLRLGDRRFSWESPINVKGVMGAGLAKAFASRFPDMFADYRRRCAHEQVKVGEPYLWRSEQLPWILNFPTKHHWREPSRLEYIEQGLAYLRQHVEEWEIKTLAVPALGCGLGGLPYATVEPLLIRELGQLGIPVKLYRPA